MIYASTEIPLFHYLKYPEIAAFKLYIWDRATWHTTGGPRLKFSPTTQPDAAHIRVLCEQIVSMYCRLESIEFWPRHLLENTLNQIDFLTYEGSFAEPEMPGLLYRQILDLIDWQQSITEKGCKIEIDGQPGAGFTLFHNEIAHTNNTFLLHAPEFRQAFFTFDNPNYGTSTDPVFCDYVEAWFSKLQHCSTRISQEGEKQRSRFFDTLRQRVEQKINANQVV